MGDSMTQQPARPLGGSDARVALITEAQRFFHKQSYHNVSTRQIAENTGVDVARFRYYFGNKAGLFETMVRETAAPMFSRMRQAVEEGQVESRNGVVSTFYREMSTGPNLPTLIFRSMKLDEDDQQRKGVEKLFRDILLLLH